MESPLAFQPIFSHRDTHSHWQNIENIILARVWNIFKSDIAVSLAHIKECFTLNSYIVRKLQKLLTIPIALIVTKFAPRRWLYGYMALMSTLRYNENIALWKTELRLVNSKYDRHQHLFGVNYTCTCIVIW